MERGPGGEGEGGARCNRARRNGTRWRRGLTEKTSQRETRVAIASAGHGAAHEVVEEAGGEEGVEQNQGAAEAAGDIAGAGTACIDGTGDGGGDDARTGDQAGTP